MITIERYHDISAGHRVYGHESKCKHLHGHNYRVHFVITAPELDAVGRVIDFSVVKTNLCAWLEIAFDHKFLLWDHDPLVTILTEQDPDGVVKVPFNPTAENLARYILERGNTLLPDGITIIKCTVDETRKCSASYVPDAP